MHLLRFVLAYADRERAVKATRERRAEGETDAVGGKERRKGEAEEPRHNEGSECCKTACDDTAVSYKK